MSRDAIKVAIIGGGSAGLATAWQLSKLNQAGAAYDITVYEKDWRLGGKGASSRDQHGRILEHGLHLWLGFYENAFRMMRECYDEVRTNGWGPSSEPGKRLAHASFEDAFIPEPHLGVAVRRKNNEWQVWSGFFPPMPGQPGEPLDIETNPFTLRGYLARSLGLAKALLQSVLAPATGTAAPGQPRPNERSLFDEAAELNFDFDPLESPGVLVEHVTRMMRLGTLTSAAGLLQAVTILESWIRERSPAVVRDSMVVKFIEAVATQTRKQLRDLVQVDEETRRKTEIIDLLMTIAVGLFRDRVLFSKDGLDAINDIDYRDWLQKHGATDTSVKSAFVTGIYDLVFAYRDGDRERPALAAGQALRGALRMFFTYRGAMFWRLGSGMGDAVFAPLYRALLKRNVKFKFQHKLTGIDFQPDGNASSAGPRRVSALHFTAPATAITDPLDRFGCWPEDPGRSEEIALTIRQAEGARPKRDSFDVVVFATGVEPLKALCHDTPLRDLPSWRDMFEHTHTVGTISAQVWLDQDLEQLGWRRGPAIVAAFEGCFNTWADMTRTLASERAHRRSAAVPEPPGTARSVAYFCGVLPDDRNARSRTDKGRQDLETLLRTGLRTVWPAAYSADGARTPLDRLVAANGKDIGGAGLPEQHISINDLGSNRYTLSLPGTLAYRISPLDLSVVNMTIAGDWTECGFNAGCVEAAVMSGMLAAHAISGQPDLNAIIGYHHP